MDTSDIPRSTLLSIKDITPMTRNFDCEIIVLQPDGEPTFTREGDGIYRFLAADRTASVIFSVWGETGKCIRSGDILRLSGVDSKLRMGRLYVAASRNSKFKRVGQDTFLFAEKPNMSEIEHLQSLNNNNRGRAPRHGENFNRNQRGYQSNNNNNNTINNTMSPHPYNNRGGRGHRGGYRGGRGNNNNNNNSNTMGNRYQHQDLDNPL